MSPVAEKAPDSRVQRVTYPWLTGFGSLAAIAYLLFVTDPGLASFYRIPAGWLGAPALYAVPGIFALALLVDLRRYREQYLRHKQDLKRLREQVAGLWEHKKQLQLKAHTFSSHADKLKLFISDKLLEYIEYDEKFLHFKSIAAEVRHNGVISFDKVQTALQRAAAASAPDDADYRAALDAMRYLWDLLDLSTAENLALHIGNLLCECEERYCQSVLNNDEPVSQSFEPAYAPQRAAWRALALVRNEALPPPTPSANFSFDDGKWHIRLAPAGALLGNENHLVLLIENLLRNAQFFSGKRGFKSPFAPISMSLTEVDGEICLRVYNRGPHIRDEDFPKLYQPGFSTRRILEHHGRGLGLYFVDQIVRGYEGRIEARNIRTPETRYTIRIELDNDEVQTELVDVIIIDGRLCCRSGDSEAVAAREWDFAPALRSIEITGVDDQLTRRFDGLAAKGRQEVYDTGHPGRPGWRVVCQPGRNRHQLSFEPLDIQGVEFEIRLPGARRRIDSSDVRA